ncbi:hypothetical protein BV20DRAFT_692752 [Pilatotrama ljubarskyi]|nr:hypothetical protein BV20DRAFT_692752 [Pilatotrama ljubarskyi]
MTGGRSLLGGAKQVLCVDRRGATDPRWSRTLDYSHTSRVGGRFAGNPRAVRSLLEDCTDQKRLRGIDGFFSNHTKSVQQTYTACALSTRHSAQSVQATTASGNDGQTRCSESQMNHHTDSCSPCMPARVSKRTRRSALGFSASAASDCDGVGGVTRTSTPPAPSVAMITFTAPAPAAADDGEWLTVTPPSCGVCGSGEPSTLASSWSCSCSEECFSSSSPARSTWVIVVVFLRMLMGWWEDLSDEGVPLSRSSGAADLRRVAASCLCCARASAAGRERQTTKTVETSIAVRTTRMMTSATMTPNGHSRVSELNVHV